MLNIEISSPQSAGATSGHGMPAEIAELTEEAETAQASYEALLNAYELSSGAEKFDSFRALLPH
jgi:hypothetical protein